MRIAQVAPLIESVPPAHYGGTERIVSYLTEELVCLGHDVTLFATHESRTSARLVITRERPIRGDRHAVDPLPYTAMMLDMVARRAQDFDILHFHIDILHFPVFRHRSATTLTTLHGRQDLPDLAPLYGHFADFPLISISLSQRAPIRSSHWVGNVYHGLPRDLFRLEAAKLPYLAFLGRISPEKGVERAIEIAARAGLPLRIAAKVDKVDRAYFDREIAPLLDAGKAEFLGEVGEEEKQVLLGQATALLTPVNWPEPFGIVMIEAMACGTPVIAFRAGAIPEVVDEGITGFVVDGVDGAVEAVRRVRELDPRVIRAQFERRFTAQRMAEDYVEIYAAQLHAASHQLPAGEPWARAAPQMTSLHE